MTAQKRRADLGNRGKLLCRHIKDGHQLILLLVIFFLSIFVVAAAAMGTNVINNEKNAVFEKKWQFSVDGGEFSEISLPNSKDVAAKSHITLKNNLPQESLQGATVLIRTSQQDVAVSVADKLIYNSADPADAASAYSSAYHFVRLPNDSKGQIITVVLSSPYDNYAGFMSQIYIGSKASNVFFLFHENGLRFITGFLVFSLGFLLMIMFLFTKGQESRASITYLGAFFVCAGYWVMVESKMLQFFLPYPRALTNSSIFALTLLPLFSGLYYYNTHTKVYKNIGKAVIIVVAALSFVFAVSASINPMLPVAVLPFYLVILIVYLLLLFVSIFLEGLRSGTFFSTSVCGILSFTVCGLLELVFYLSNIKEYHQSNFLMLGLLLLCVLMVVDSVQNFSRVYRAAVKVDALSILAYIDSLTGLGNRTAFLEEMSTITIGEKIGITIAMYDVNNLKPVNDTLGHLLGDALLRHCAKTIKAGLRQEDKVYRIGGDEFVAIIRHDLDFDSSSMESRLQLLMEKENKKPLSYTLSIAYGFATFSSSVDKTLFDTQSRADFSMYACKKLQKAALREKDEGLVLDGK